MKRAASIIILSLLLIGTLPLAFKILPVKAGLIIVPDNYGTVQGAINAANMGDTIYIRDGIYYGNVIVNKSVSLIGESKDAIISQDNVLYTVEVIVDNVTIEELTINNLAFASGILLDYSSNCSITNNNFGPSNLAAGIVVQGGSKNRIVKNEIEGCSLYGILVGNSHENVIMQNKMDAHETAFWLADSNSNYIFSNEFRIHSLAWSCVVLMGSNDNIVEGNRLYIDYATTASLMELWSSCNNSIFHNNFRSWMGTVWIDAYSENNTWDDGYPSGGNYWNDYSGIDLYSGPFQNETGSDRIGDTPHIINGNNQDNYPLMNQWTPPKNLDTGLSYPTIQEAINAPETLDGHRISIPSRAYYEHVVVNKSLSLIGANKKTTILDGNRTGTVISVTADNVTITRFTIRNSGTNLLNSGIYLNSISNCSIKDNILTNNNNGITLDHTNRTTLLNNNVSYNTVDGIHILHSLNNTIENNFLMQNMDHGISLELYASINVLYHNAFINNTNQAYVDAYSSNNIWNDAYISGGNFWSDYNGTDLLRGPHQNETGSDGIGDTPYVIDGGNQDNYPLMQVWPQHVTPPLIVITSPEHVVYASDSVSLTFTVDEPASWMGYSLDNQANVTILGNITLTGLSEGLHSITVSANDSYGNMGQSVAVHFAIGLARIKIIPEVVTFESGFVVGQNFTIAVVIENVFDLQCFALYFGWNTTYLEYLGHTATVPWNDHPTPEPPSPYAGILNAPAIELENVVDEGGVSGEPGTMACFAYLSFLSAPSFSGNGTVCVMTFRVRNQSTVDVEVPIYFTSTVLYDPQFAKISHTVTDGKVNLCTRLPWPDINNDGVVDIYDVVIAAKAYGSRVGDLNWNILADLCPEWGKIDLFDLVTLAYHYGETYP